MKKVITGIVMEIGSNSAIIMTKDGEFLNVKKPSHFIELGQEITSTVYAKNNMSFIKYISIAAAILLMLVPFVYLKEAYATVAYVNVDINPSLELGITRYNKVNQVIPLNEDAKILLENVSLKDLDIKEALDVVIIEAKDKGYIEDGRVNNIEITLVKVKESNINVSRETLVQYAKSKVSEIDVDATIEINKANKEIHNEAKKENMSTNKYLDKVEGSKKESIKVDVKKSTPSKNEDKKDKPDKDNGKSELKNPSIGQNNEKTEVDGNTVGPKDKNSENEDHKSDSQGKDNSSRENEGSSKPSSQSAGNSGNASNGGSRSNGKGK